VHHSQRKLSAGVFRYEVNSARGSRTCLSQGLARRSASSALWWITGASSLRVRGAGSRPASRYSIVRRPTPA